MKGGDGREIIDKCNDEQIEKIITELINILGKHDNLLAIQFLANYFCRTGTEVELTALNTLFENTDEYLAEELNNYYNDPLMSIITTEDIQEIRETLKNRNLLEQKSMGESLSGGKRKTKKTKTNKKNKKSMRKRKTNKKRKPRRTYRRK